MREVDERLERQLVEIVERRAVDMNSQEISMTLNAVSKLESAANAMVREGQHRGGRLTSYSIHAIESTAISSLVLNRNDNRGKKR